MYGDNMFARWLFLYGSCYYIFFDIQMSYCEVDILPTNKTALLMAPDDLEEIEYATVIDILRRAKINLTTASEYKHVDNMFTTHYLVFNPDIPLKKALSKENLPYHAVIVVGGHGYLYIAANDLAMKTIKKHLAKNKIVALIGEAPHLLEFGKMCRGRKITCEKKMIPELIKHYTITGASTTVDGNLITSSSPATAMEFALTIVEKLLDAKTADQVAEDIGYRYKSVLRK